MVALMADNFAAEIVNALLCLVSAMELPTVMTAQTKFLHVVVTKPASTLANAEANVFHVAAFVTVTPIVTTAATNAIVVTFFATTQQCMQNL